MVRIGSHESSGLASSQFLNLGFLAALYVIRPLDRKSQIPEVIPLQALSWRGQRSGRSGASACIAENSLSRRSLIREFGRCAAEGTSPRLGLYPNG